MVDDDDGSRLNFQMICFSQCQYISNDKIADGDKNVQKNENVNTKLFYMATWTHATIIRTQGVQWRKRCVLVHQKKAIPMYQELFENYSEKLNKFEDLKDSDKNVYKMP